MPNALRSLLIAVFTVACGARTELKGPIDPIDAAVPPVDRPTTDRPTPVDLPVPIDVPGRDQVTATCPASQRAVESQSVTLTGSGRSAQGRPLSYRWTIEQSPIPGAIFGETRPTIAFPLTVAGDYRLRLTVSNDRGQSDSCVTAITADPAIDLRCPNDRSVFVSETAALNAAANSRLGQRVTVQWRVVARPPGSAANPVPGDSLAASLRTDLVGDYDLELNARDASGRTASCRTRVHADPDVVVTCPEDVTSRPFTSVSLAGRAVSRLGRPLTYRWTIERSPTTSTARLDPTNQPTTRFTFDVAGDWTWRLTAANDRGNSASCTVRAFSASTEAIRVELVWNLNRTCRSCNPEGGGIDIDLHLADARRHGGRWGSNAVSGTDCYYANCICAQGQGSLCPAGAIEWDPAGAPNNPQLDIDHIRDLPGPENINVLQAAPGAQFVVGVHYFSGAEPTPTLVRVYCGGVVVFQSEPVTLNGGNSASDNPMWRVGVITVGTDGRQCSFARCGAPGNLSACIRAESAW